MSCELCGTEHNGDYGSGRFCSQKCSRSYSSRLKREEVNKKVSETLKKRSSNDPLYGFKDKSRGDAARAKIKYPTFEPNDYSLLSTRTVRTYLLDEDVCCSLCGITEWLDKKLTMEIDHTDGNNKNNDASNCRIVCPNCHSHTPTWRGRNKSQTSSIDFLFIESMIRRFLLESHTNPDARSDCIKMVYGDEHTCAVCKNVHDGTIGGGNFCSVTCQAKYSLSKHSPIIIDTHRRKNFKRFSIVSKTFEQVSEFDLRWFIMHEQKYQCNKCGKSEWNGAPITLELEHKDGVSSNNTRENLECLCPNCHSQTDTWRGRNTAASVSDDILLNALKSEKNIRQALLSVGMAGKGSNYKRAKKLLGLI